MSTKKSTKKSKKGLHKQYLSQREHFFQKHPFARVLIGLFIVAFAAYIGVQYRNYWAKLYVYMQLDEEGIPPQAVTLN